MPPPSDRHSTPDSGFSLDSDILGLNCHPGDLEPQAPDSDTTSNNQTAASTSESFLPTSSKSKDEEKSRQPEDLNDEAGKLPTCGSHSTIQECEDAAREFHELLLLGYSKRPAIASENSELKRPASRDPSQSPGRQGGASTGECKRIATADRIASDTGTGQLQVCTEVPVASLSDEDLSQFYTTKENVPVFTVGSNSFPWTSYTCNKCDDLARHAEPDHWQKWGTKKYYRLDHIRGHLRSNCTLFYFCAACPESTYTPEDPKQVRGFSTEGDLARHVADSLAASEASHATEIRQERMYSCIDPECTDTNKYEKKFKSQKHWNDKPHTIERPRPTPATATEPARPPTYYRRTPPSPGFLYCGITGNITTSNSDTTSGPCKSSDSAAHSSNSFCNPEAVHIVQIDLYHRHQHENHEIPYHGIQGICSACEPLRSPRYQSRPDEAHPSRSVLCHMNTKHPIEGQFGRQVLEN